MTSSIQRVVAMAYSIVMAYSTVDFTGQAVRPDKLKDDSKNMDGQINVSGLIS